MAIDTTVLPALERELEYAKHNRPGGQPPDPGRIKAIEDQILRTKNAIAQLAGAAVEPEVETADAKPKTEKAAKADTAEKAVVEAEPAAEKAA